MQKKNNKSELLKFYAIKLINIQLNVIAMRFKPGQCYFKFGVLTAKKK